MPGSRLTKCTTDDARGPNPALLENGVRVAGEVAIGKEKQLDDLEIYRVHIFASAVAYALVPDLADHAVISFQSKMPFDKHTAIYVSLVDIFPSSRIIQSEDTHGASATRRKGGRSRLWHCDGCRLKTHACLPTELPDNAVDNAAADESADCLHGQTGRGGLSPSIWIRNPPADAADGHRRSCVPRLRMPAAFKHGAGGVSASCPRNQLVMIGTNASIDPSVPDPSSSRDIPDNPAREG